MKLVHFGLIALVCFGMTLAEMSSASHMMEDLDLSWLEPALVEQIQNGELKIVTHDSPQEIDNYKSTVAEKVIHIWQNNNNGWEYRIVNYDGPAPSDATYNGMEGEAVAALEETLSTLEVTIPTTTTSAPAEPTPVQPTIQPVIHEPTPPPQVEVSIHEPTPVQPTFTPQWSNSLTESSTHTEGEEPVTIIQDGKVVTLYKNPTPDDNSPYIFIEIDDLWEGEHKSTDATELAAKFAQVHGKELSLDEYTILNNLVTTPNKQYWHQYNYWRVRRDQIEKALSAITVTFSSKISNRDVKYYANLIRECKNGYVSAVVNSTELDVNNAEDWEIHAEMLVATCSEDNEKIQLFGWSGSKRGQYLPGAYSESNAEAVSDHIKRWLFAHAGLLIQCSDSPVDEMGIWSHPKITLRSSAPGHSQAIPIHAESLSSFH